jgi:ribonuclease BN (tRNA processing enzyme)
LHITVLGRSPSWEDAGGACSGYLVEEGDGHLLVDCGNGVFGKLRAARDYRSVGTIVVSHLHADHMLDLVPFAYALRYGRGAPVRPRLVAPVGAGETFRRLCGSWGSEDLIERSFALDEYAPGDERSVEGMLLRFTAVPHYVPTCAIDVRSATGARFTYGADCGPNDAIVELARGTGLLMLEGTLDEPETEEPRGHLTPREAGEHARRAGVPRLVVTHASDEMDAGWILAQARAGFGGADGAVALSREGDVYEV